MRTIVSGSSVLALSFLVVVGCSTPAEPAPAGYHYDMVDIGKQRKQQVLVADSGNATTMMVRSNSVVPGPGDYWINVPVGKQTSRVLVHDEELKPSGEAWLAHFNSEQVCPNCKEVYVTVGKHVERYYYCNSKMHVPPATPNQ